ncbi:MAG TPA: entericidin EcnA/B family protein [Alphaproteobacteria bacterium]|jgi:predicted small secreted protein|nr:entericidin EcnA/B family protein [Alphaproteobacteria bacterium]|tara:strand:- start:1713 stop:1838 length:126 start_codon:yes stop_codon:yes gene_type:complete
MKKWIALMLAASSLALTACNTIQGFGRDVEATGDAIEDAAD